MTGLPNCEKNFEDMYQRRRVTDRRTDRWTDILPRHSPRCAYALRGKNKRQLNKTVKYEYN